MLKRRERDILLVVGTVVACATLYFTYKAADNSLFDLFVASRTLQPKQQITVNVPKAPNEVIENPTKHYDFTAVETLNAKGCLKDSVLKEAFMVAKGMYDNGQRDLMYEKLAKHALCNNDTRFAATITDAMYNNDSQDMMYLKIVEYLIKVQKFKEADWVAEEMYHNRNEDEAKTLIIRAMETK